MSTLTDRDEVQVSGRWILTCAVLAGPVCAALLWAGLPATIAAAGGMLAGLAAVLAMIDARTHRLPDRWVLRSYIVVLAPPAAGAIIGDISWSVLVTMLLAGAVTALGYLLLGLLRVGGLGLGDVKFSGALGAWLGYFGWSAVLAGPVATFVLAGLWALGLLATRRVDLRAHIPLGPWMVLGTAAVSAIAVIDLVT